MRTKPNCALAQKSVGKKIFNYGLMALKHLRRCEIVLAANVGGMVSWGLDTDNLSTEYKLNKYNE